MDLHVKLTSKHQYLHAKSCNPKHGRTAIPYSQGLRVKLICSRGRTSHWEQINWKTISQRQHTPSNCLTWKLIEQLVHQIIAVSRACSDQRNLEGVPLVVTYHLNLPRLKRTIRCYRHILQDSDRLRQAIHLSPSLLIVDQETYAIYWYMPIFLPKQEIPLATFAAKLKGAWPAPYCLPLIHSPAALLVNVLN